jgi:Phage integrase family
VPVNKTNTAFTKPVHPIVGQRIEEWEAVRPQSRSILDAKTGQYVDYLFVWTQGAIGGHHYINRHLIPLLCRKAGVPERDARGPITNHRARSTIASQLYNAKEGLSLFELQEWLGHTAISSTQHYAKVSRTKLAKAYVDADYFGRNVATVEVLIDQEAVLSGAAAAGETWKYYDLGHGFCTYSFYEQCEHRMACAKCPFYLPKDSARAQILEGKANLARMLEMIPLTEEERAAVEDGQEAYDRLLAKLADVPTPAGPTPRTLAGRVLPVLPPSTPRRTAAP